MKAELLARALWRRLSRVAARRQPDFIIGGAERPYLRRWWLIPRNPIFNVYLHEFRRSDDDRALHDHPWFNVSLLLAGRYSEETIRAGGIHRRRMMGPGSLRVRAPWTAHRVELQPGERCWSLFVTGPRVREWGFHCPAGWVHWRRFTDPNDTGRVGPGCG